MKNKDIHEWLLDEGIDPLTTVTIEKGEYYLSDILEKHLTDQLHYMPCCRFLINKYKMKEHKDKGRYVIALAILQSEKTSTKLKDIAFKCLLSYSGK